MHTYFNARVQSVFFTFIKLLPVTYIYIGIGIGGHVQWSVVQVLLRSCCFPEGECVFFCGLHYSYNTFRMVNPNQLLYHWQTVQIFTQCPPPHHACHSVPLLVCRVTQCPPILVIFLCLSYSSVVLKV